MNKVEPIVKRLLPCVLTSDERAERGKTLANLEHALTEIEQKKKLAADRFKDEITVTELAIDDAVEVIRSGQENREVDCEWKPDWTTMVKSLVRLDTSETVQTMPISENERQTALPLDGELCSECPDAPICRDSGGILYCEKHRNKAVGEVTYLTRDKTPAEEADDKNDTSHINRKRK